MLRRRRVWRASHRLWQKGGMVVASNAEGSEKGQRRVREGLEPLCRGFARVRWSDITRLPRPINVSFCHDVALRGCCGVRRVALRPSRRASRRVAKPSRCDRRGFCVASRCDRRGCRFRVAAVRGVRRSASERARARRRGRRGRARARRGRAAAAGVSTPLAAAASVTSASYDDGRGRRHHVRRRHRPRRRSKTVTPPAVVTPPDPDPDAPPPGVISPSRRSGFICPDCRWRAPSAQALATPRPHTTVTTVTTARHGPRPLPRRHDHTLPLLLRATDLDRYLDATTTQYRYYCAPRTSSVTASWRSDPVLTPVLTRHSSRTV